MIPALASLFGSGIPDLSGVTAMPNMDMGSLGTSLGGMNVSSSFGMPQQPNYMGMLSALGGLGSQGDSQQAPMMAPAPMQPLQAGGGQFEAPYQTASTFQSQPAAQRLSGLLGNVYGTL